MHLPAPNKQNRRFRDKVLAASCLRFWGQEGPPALYNGSGCPVMSGRLRERSLPMDTQTVIALCDVFLVLIGIIGLVLVRRE